MRTRARRTAAAACVAALAALVPVVGVAGPAGADASCQDETPSMLTGCDDTTPPETTLTAVAPAPTAKGKINATSIRFDFAGSYADTGDSGPIGFECQLYATASAPATWTACTSPQVFSGLAQSGATPYTFRVRAVDSDDAAQAACDDNPLDFCIGTPDVEDRDPTPATTTFAVDTTAPNTFLTHTPQDDVRPDWPVVLTRTPQLVLNSNEGGVDFRCTVNGTATPCHEGTATLDRLRSGPQTFVAQAVDGAGNVDPVPATTRFFVPADLGAAKGWRRTRSGDAFDGDLVRTAKVGAVLRIGHQRKIHELRLIGPSGPDLGRIEVRVGHSRWYVVDLHATKAGQRSYLVRDQFAPSQSGAITIRVLSVPRGGSVQLDALVARG